MGLKTGLLIIVGLTFGAIVGHAQNEGSRYDEAKEAEIEVKAKKRLYPGGRDESDLRVQAQVITPVRKLAPQAEVKEESSDE